MKIWMTLKEQMPDEGEKVSARYADGTIVKVTRSTSPDEYEAFNNDNGEDMGEPDFWTPMPMDDEVSG